MSLKYSSMNQTHETTFWFLSDTAARGGCQSRTQRPAGISALSEHNTNEAKMNRLLQANFCVFPGHRRAHGESGFLTVSRRPRSMRRDVQTLDSRLPPGQAAAVTASAGRIQWRGIGSATVIPPQDGFPESAPLLRPWFRHMPAAAAFGPEISKTPAALPAIEARRPANPFPGLAAGETAGTLHAGSLRVSVNRTGRTNPGRPRRSLD